MISKHLNSIAIALIVIFAAAAFVLTHPQSTPGVSNVSGLMALKTMAQTTMPYDVAMANQKPTLLEFYADWCTTCQALSSTMQDLHEQWGDRINFVMLDIDDPRWAKQVKQFQVNGVPTLTLLSHDHTITDTLIGNTPKTVLNQELSELL